jgi:hypothetical protein
MPRLIAIYRHRYICIDCIIKIVKSNEMYLGDDRSAQKAAMRLTEMRSIACDNQYYLL